MGSRARARVLLLRRADHPGRVAALLPRFDVGRAPGARPAGTLPGARGGAREALGRARPPADRRRPRRAPEPLARGDRGGPAGHRGPLRALPGRARARRGERLRVRRRPDRLHRRRVRARRGRRDARAPDRHPRRARPRDPAPALPGRPPAVRDRRGHRLLADARVPDHPLLTGEALRVRLRNEGAIPMSVPQPTEPPTPIAPPEPATPAVPDEPTGPADPTPDRETPPPDDDPE